MPISRYYLLKPLPVPQAASGFAVMSTTTVASTRTIIAYLVNYLDYDGLPRDPVGRRCQAPRHANLCVSPASGGL